MPSTVSNQTLSTVFQRKFLIIYARHDAKKAEQRENRSTDDGTTQDDDTFVQLPEEFGVVGVGRAVA